MANSKRQRVDSGCLSLGGTGMKNDFSWVQDFFLE